MKEAFILPSLNQANCPEMFSESERWKFARVESELEGESSLAGRWIEGGMSYPTFSRHPIIHIKLEANLPQAKIVIFSVI